MLALLALQALPVLLAQLPWAAPFPLSMLAFPLLVVRKAICGGPVEGQEGGRWGSSPYPENPAGAGRREQEPQEPPSAHLWGRACCQWGLGPRHFHRSLRSGGSGKCRSLGVGQSERPGQPTAATQHPGSEDMLPCQRPGFQYWDPGTGGHLG